LLRRGAESDYMGRSILSYHFRGSDDRMEAVRARATLEVTENAGDFALEITAGLFAQDF